MPSLKDIRKQLSKAAWNPKTGVPKVIADANNEDYFVQRIQEEITMFKMDSRLERLPRIMFLCALIMVIHES